MNEETTRWELSGSTTCVTLIAHNPPSSGRCGPLDINMVSSVSESTRASTAHATATQSLDGAVVRCREGPDSSDVLVGVVTISVIG